MLTARYRDALGFAFDLHHAQLRKGSDVPYLAHLIGVSSMVLEHGGDEDEGIAGLLHDAVEDQGGAPVLVRIRDRYGARVADIVDGCTDSMDEPKPPWRARKERYLEHLRAASASVLLVSGCDKLYNARAIVADLRIAGDAVWHRFSGGRDGVLWYYRSLRDLMVAGGAPVASELARVVDRMEALAT